MVSNPMEIGAENGRTMLNLIAHQGDGGAVARIVVDHADMVYTTCRRVLGNDAEAADVAQETFLQFLKHSGKIRNSIGGWLHRVATSRSIDLLRQNAARRQRETAYATDIQPSASNHWCELEPLIDEALESLPADARQLLIEHYLERQSMVRIGKRHGLSQPTVSRRVAAALDQLRNLLRAKGVVIGTAALGTFLTSAVQAAPAPMMQALGKLMLAHTALHTTEAAAAGSALLGGGAKAAGTAVTCLLLIGVGTHLYRPSDTAVEPATNTSPSMGSFGFATNVSWATGPDGRWMVLESSGTNYFSIDGDTPSPWPGVAPPRR
jgi:RNA polymerase sigma factor (sigma-70 family)